MGKSAIFKILDRMTVFLLLLCNDYDYSCQDSRRVVRRYMDKVYPQFTSVLGKV